jgi:hypothetical protein
MNQLVNLACEPHAICRKIEELCDALEDNKQIASVCQEPRLEFWKRGFFEKIGKSLHIVLWKSTKQRAATIQSVIEKSLFKNAHLLQAIYDIHRGKTENYTRFFNLHIFKKVTKDQLKILPQIYLKLWQQTCSFAPVLRSMSPHLKALRDGAKNCPDVVITSSEGIKIYAHIRWLSGMDKINTLPPSSSPLLEYSWNVPANDIRLFLDVVYGVSALDGLKDDELRTVYELAHMQAYTNLENAAALLMHEKRLAPREDAFEFSFYGPAGY